MKTRLTNHGINTDQLVAFDLETTGVDPDTARIVTGSLVHFIGGLPMKTQSWLADPGIDIPAEATAIHGITTEHARENGRDHDDVAREIADAITACWTGGKTLVVFNAAYDLQLLSRTVDDFEIFGAVFDPLVVDRARDKYRKGKRRLGDIARIYGIEANEAAAHTAAGDAEVAGRLAHEMLTGNHAILAVQPVGRLMTAQNQWHRQYLTGLRDYLASLGRDVDDFKISPWPNTKTAPKFEIDVPSVNRPDLIYDIDLDDSIQGDLNT